MSKYHLNYQEIADVINEFRQGPLNFESTSMKSEIEILSI